MLLSDLVVIFSQNFILYRDPCYPLVIYSHLLRQIWSRIDTISANLIIAWCRSHDDFLLFHVACCHHAIVRVHLSRLQHVLICLDIFCCALTDDRRTVRPLDKVLALPYSQWERLLVRRSRIFAFRRQNALVLDGRGHNRFTEAVIHIAGRHLIILIVLDMRLQMLSCALSDLIWVPQDYLGWHNLRND